MIGSNKFAEPQRKAIESVNKLSIKIQDDKCGVIFFSKENKDDQVEVRFHRTLRIPEDDKDYPLPSSMGTFPIEKVDDYLNTVPEHFKKHGGIFICIQQREALRMEFINTNTHYPHALKIASGKINVLSGEEWDERILMERKVQDYIVTPIQNRLDGINSGGFRKVKQFVAMPLGKGYTLESQLRAYEEESIGGIQIICFNSDSKKREEKFGPPKINSPKKPLTPQTKPPTSRIPSSSSVSSSTPMVKSIPPVNTISPKKPLIPQTKPTLPSASSTPMVRGIPPAKMSVVASQKKTTQPSPRSSLSAFPSSQSRSKLSDVPQPKEMGMAPGGSLKQAIVSDPYTASFWDEETKARIFVHLVNTKMYTQITGKKPSISPISKEVYQKLNYPWYEQYVEESGVVPTSEILEETNTVKETDLEQLGKSIDSTSSLPVGKIIKQTKAIEKADLVPPPRQTKPHALRDILPKEMLFHIASYLTVPPLNRLARCDRYLLEAFFNLTVPKVYEIQKRREEFKKKDIEAVMVSVKDLYKEDEDSLVQTLVWKRLVLFYFPNYSSTLNIKNWMHVIRRRVNYLMKKSPNLLPLTKNLSTDVFKIPNKPGFIENCEWEYECPLKTTNMERKAGAIFCNVCKENVYEAFTPEDFNYHISQGHCVTISIAPKSERRGRISRPMQ